MAKRIYTDDMAEEAARLGRAHHRELLDRIEGSVEAVGIDQRDERRERRHRRERPHALPARARPGLPERTRELPHEVHGADRDIYFVAVGDAVLPPAFALVERLRDARPDLKIEMNSGGGSFKSQMKRADRSGAKVALILGDEEIVSQTVVMKPLREDVEQVCVEWSRLSEALADYFDS